MMWYNKLPAGCDCALAIIFFFLGGIMCSATTCFFERRAKGESWVHGRSHCNYCGHPLSIIDLIPFFGSWFSRLECPYCGHFISPYYMISEIWCGFVFYMIFFVSPNPVTMAVFMFIYTAIFMVILAVVFRRKKKSDEEHYIGDK